MVIINILKNDARHLQKKGFTLVEMLATIAIMGVLLSIATLNFNSMQTKYSLERQVNEMLSDINSARLDAIHSKDRKGIVLNPFSYVLKNYSSDNESITAGTVQRTVNMKFELKPLSGGSYSGGHYLFDSRGFLYNSTGTTITVSPFNTGANDCIILSVGRINPGKMTNGACVF